MIVGGIRVDHALTVCYQDDANIIILSYVLHCYLHAIVQCINKLRLVLDLPLIEQGQRIIFLDLDFKTLITIREKDQI